MFHVGACRASQFFEQRKTSVFSTNTQSRFESVFLDGVLGLTVSLYLCIAVINICVEVEGPQRTPCQLKKSFFKGPRRRPRSCWEELKRTVFPQQGFIDLFSKQINDFLPTWPPPLIESGQTCPGAPGGSKGCLALMGSLVVAGSEMPYWFSA